MNLFKKPIGIDCFTNDTLFLLIYNAFNLHMLMIFFIFRYLKETNIFIDYWNREAVLIHVLTVHECLLREPIGIDYLFPLFIRKL